jgi:GNAT superfamily N-acetyltransferase
MLTLRPASPPDAGTVADIDLASRAAALPTVQWAHPPNEVRDWIARVLLPRGGVWLAERAGQTAGYMALHEDWVEQLYIHPAHWRGGIGSALLAHAKALRPAGLRLWCFQVNAPARAFYEAHGFAALVHTDGAGNEEREPDILYAWPRTAWQSITAPPGPPGPLAP